MFDTGILAKSRTSYKNILETLGATMVVGSEDAVCTTGHIRIGTATPEMLENSMDLAVLHYPVYHRSEPAARHHLQAALQADQ